VGRQHEGKVGRAHLDRRAFRVELVFLLGLFAVALVVRLLLLIRRLRQTADPERLAGDPAHREERQGVARGERAVKLHVLHGRRGEQSRRIVRAEARGSSRDRRHGRTEIGARHLLLAALKNHIDWPKISFWPRADRQRALESFTFPFGNARGGERGTAEPDPASASRPR